MFGGAPDITHKTPNSSQNKHAIDTRKSPVSNDKEFQPDLQRLHLIVATRDPPQISSQMRQSSRGDWLFVSVF